MPAALVRQPHADRRIGAVFLLLGMALLLHGILSAAPVVRLSAVPGTAPLLVSPLLLWFSTAFGTVGFAYRRGNPNVFGKRSDGHLNRSRFLFLLPYLALAQGNLALSLTLYRFPPFHEVTPGVFLGGVPCRRDLARLKSKEITAVLDLTAEFSRLPFCSFADYYCVPLLDATAPTPEEIQSGAVWIDLQRRQGKTVYVHCAKGVGRSATLAAAYLMLSGQARNANEAVDLLRAVRTRVKLTPVQQNALEQFTSLPV